MRETRRDGTSTDQSQQTVTSRPTSPSASAPTNESFLVTPPSITLPKGGGAICGIGEKFVVNPVTGTGSLTIPIYTSPGRDGFGRQMRILAEATGCAAFGQILVSNRSSRGGLIKGLPRIRMPKTLSVFIPGRRALFPRKPRMRLGIGSLKLSSREPLTDRLLSSSTEKFVDKHTFELNQVF